MIKAGLIGEKLGHSMSPAIHQKFYETANINGSYELFETSADGLSALLDSLLERGYVGVNVTIPYKTEVMQYLDEISKEAQAIGAVNTIHFKNGKRYGHNTDYFGLKTLLESSDVALRGKRVAILGTGGAAKCAYKLAADMGAGERIVVSRHPDEADTKLKAVDYSALDALESIDVLVNTTPVGMSPNVDKCAVSDSVIQKSAQVVDLIYNPLQTLLLKKAKALNKTSVNGLLMLVAQAIKAQEIWNGRAFDRSIYSQVYEHVLGTMSPKSTNIVLIGMPGSGKTSIGKQLAQRLNMDFADTDTMIEDEYGAIPKIFETRGESVFRDYEREAAAQAANRIGAVISTGGGIILDEHNMKTLGRTGTIVFIDRPIAKLLEDIDIEGRPLLKEGKHALVALLNQRENLYRKFAEIIVDNTADIESCIAYIINKLEENKFET